jgi:integrase
MQVSYSQYLALFSKWGTRDNYGRALRHFLNHIYPPDQKRSVQDTDLYDRLSLHYLNGGRDVPADLRSFAVALNDFAPKTSELYMAGTIGWLEENEIEVSKAQRRRITQKLPRGGVQTLDATLDHSALRAILAHMDLKGRALILVMASSGMRIGEALSLPISALDLSCRPALISIPGSLIKNGSPRKTFITEEAAQVLQEWLKVRGNYLASAQNRNNGLIAAGKSGRKAPAHKDDRVFPFSQRVAAAMWANALSAANLLEKDPTTGRLTRTYHGLRRFYLSQAKLVIPAEIPETLAGHRGYLTDAYRRYTDDQLAQYYLKAEPQLTILAPQEVREIQSEFRQKMDAHSEILENLVTENIQLKKRLESVEAVQAQVNRLSAVLAEHPEVFRE